MRMAVWLSVAKPAVQVDARRSQGGMPKSEKATAVRDGILRPTRPINTPPPAFASIPLRGKF